MKQIVTVYMCVRVCVCTMCVVMQYTIITGICNCVCFFYPDSSYFILYLFCIIIYIIFMCYNNVCGRCLFIFFFRLFELLHISFFFLDSAKACYLGYTVV